MAKRKKQEIGDEPVDAAADETFSPLRCSKREFQVWVQGQLQTKARRLGVRIRDNLTQIGGQAKFDDRHELEIAGAKALEELERDDQAADRIELLLERLREGVCGVCLQCGQDIPRRRIVALPDALRCIRCQREAEKSGESIY